MKETKTHIYFWGGIYSQWYNSQFEFKREDGQVAKVGRAEAYMMYQKAILFNAPNIAKKILETNDPKKQKALGQDRKEIRFNQEVWDKNKFDIVVKGNLLKFSQNEKLKKQLLDTGDKVLVEGSPYDKIWGVGLKWDDPKILDEKNWKGENLLGKALMKVRDILRTQNGDKLKEFFNKPAISKEEYEKEINKETSNSVDFNEVFDELEQDRESGKLKEQITSENFGEKLLESANEALEHVKGEKELKTTEVKLYDKLIRDKIPQIIHKNKKTCETYKEEEKNKLLKYYVKKIEEELKEIVSSKSKEELIEELADLSEVMDGLLDNLNLKDSVLKAKEKKKEERGGFSNLILKSVRSEKHEWFTYKNDKFRSCKKCGVIENNKNTNGNCVGKVEMKLRLSDRDFNKVEKELENPSEPNERLIQAMKENKDLLDNLEEGMKDVREGNGISTEELKEKIKSKRLEDAQKRTDNLPDNGFDGKPLLMEIQGSILEAKEDIIAQGCNCAGASGAGIAKYIAQEYPESDKKYKEMCKNKQFHLGNVMFHKEKGKVQAFCGTQQYYGRYLKMDKDSVEKRYQAIEECLQKIYEKAKSESLSVALPRIGCGRARADWNRVKGIIQKVFHDHPVTIYWIPDRYSKK